MSDWSTIGEESKSKSIGSGPRCQVQILLNYLPGEDAEALGRALEDPAISNAGLFRAIRDRMGEDPMTPSHWSIGNHRRGNCRCGR